VRYPDDQKEQTRARVLEEAARVARRDGVVSASVAKVMSGLGMTVGGFYRHFRSQEALAGESIAFALRQSTRALLAGLEDVRGRKLARAIVERYLSDFHRDNVEQGCPMPSTISEVSRLGDDARAPLVAEIEAVIEEIGSRIGDRDRAITMLCACVGAMALGRAVSGKLGDEIRRATRDTLTRE
jgi:TetR/AcrR family transcriptional regulator, transcriptional repressor for nem operon